MSSKRLGLLALVVTAMIVAACQPATDQGQVATLQAQLAAAQNQTGGANADAVATLQAQLTQAAAAAPAGPAQEVFKPAFKDANSFVYMAIGEQDSLDPASDYETGGAEILRQTYDTLTFYKGSSVEEFVPMLATEWKHSDDGKTWTFTIRKGVTFHDGGTLEAHDVAYTLQRNMLSGWDDDLGGPQWIMLDQFFGVNVIGAAGTKDGVTGQNGGDDTKTCEAVQNAVKADDAAGTVTMVLDHPTGYFLQTLAQSYTSIIDQEYMVKNGDWGGKCDDWRKWYGLDISKTTLYGKENGTGPYMLDHWTPGDELVMKAYDGWWLKEPMWEGSTIKGVPTIKNVTIKVVTEWSTRLAAMQAGDADQIDVDPAYWQQIDPMVKEQVEGTELKADKSNLEQKNPGGSLRMYHNIPSVQSTDIFMNEKINVEGGNPLVGSGKLDGKGIPPDFFSDIHIRKAFNYCFDRDTFIKEVAHGEALPRRGPIISGMPGYDEKSEIYSYDIDKCAAELALAWNGDVAKNGFTLSLAYNAGNDSRKIAEELLRDGITAAGVKMSGGDRSKQNISVGVILMAWPSFLAAQRGGALPVYTIGWLEDFHHPHNWVSPYMSCNGLYSGSQGIPEDVCKPWDDLINQGKVELDPAKANTIYGQLQKGAMDYALDVFVEQPTVRHYEQVWLSGWYYNPLFSGWYYPAMSKTQPQ